jgi:hypothetical protein
MTPVHAAMASMPPSAAHVHTVHVVIRLHCSAAVAVLTSQDHTSKADKSESYDSN